MTPPVLARIVHAHDDLGEDGYHQWVFLGDSVKADKNGRPNPRIVGRSWQRWICNNTDCAGEAFVHNDAVVVLIEEAEASL